MSTYRFIIITAALILAACSATGAPPQPAASSSASTSPPAGLVQSSLPPVESGWRLYTNKRYKISFRYPSRGTVVIENLGTPYEWIDVCGQDLGCADFSVTITWYPGDPLYNPPAGTDVTTWITKDQTPYPFKHVATPRIISGLKALHVIDDVPSKRMAQTERYYVIKDNSLYEIKVYDFSVKERAAVETKILDSIEIR
jgi:hypothetical protein